MPVGFGPQRRSDNEARSLGVPVGFGFRKAAARMEVTAAYAGGICFASLTGGAGGRVPVGLPSDNQARSFVRRWDLAPGKQRCSGACFCGCSQRRGDGRCWRLRAGRVNLVGGRVQGGSASADLERMEVTAAYAGGISFCGCSQRRGDERCWRPRAGRIFSTEAQRQRSENELGASVRRWDLAWRRRQGWW